MDRRKVGKLHLAIAGFGKLFGLLRELIPRGGNAQLVLIEEPLVVQ